MPNGIVCPTVTPFSISEYRQQLEVVQPFANRIHLDFMDGIFTSSSSPALSSIWWQPGPRIDLHLMYRRPMESLETVIHLQPHLVIIHAEAEGVAEFLRHTRGLGIKRGIALLADTPAASIESYLPDIDHVLVFSGNLGHFGGTVDLGLLDKVQVLKRMKPSLEIGWDGGINDQNAKYLVEGGVDVLNVGGYIQKSSDPEGAYAKLIQVIDGGN